MPNVINLLPDAIANQIAAGEVIQRPASVVKELLENSIDAKSTHIKLIIKNAGKTLLQVIDNGVGMNESDARMSFEKHATSKITHIDDLFSIYTKGFRGEALASVAAVAQVEMKTKTADSTVGTVINIEGSEIKSQEPCQAPQGTSIAVKNLFFNVPARRNFLKSNNVETKHIVDEFIRVALPHYDIGFSLFNNDEEIYHLKPSNLRQRIVSILGDNYNQRLVPISEETEVVEINGFIGKPDFAKKTRGEQYIFVNNRFIKNHYLNHAIFSAYEDILPKDRYPLFVLFIKIDSAKIDINVHPSKTEIKFEEERLIYTFVNAAARHGLASHSVTPSLDFEQENVFDQMGTFSQKDKDFNPTNSVINYSKTDFPFSAAKFDEKREKDNLANWEDAYKIGVRAEQSVKKELPIEEKSAFEESTKPYQIHHRYIVSSIKSGFILVDQQAAHERVLFENYIKSIDNNEHATQKQLFPQNISLSPTDASLMREIMEDVNKMGFDIQEFGSDSFIIHGLPADIVGANEEKLVEELLEQYKNNLQVGKLDKRQSLAHSLAKSACIKQGKTLSTQEMSILIDELFACQNPYTAPNGRKTFVKYELKDLEKDFGN